MKEMKRGSIYYADLSPSVGSEQTGVRPVLILQNDTGNQFSATTIVAAITSKKTKHWLPTHVAVTGCGLKYKSIVLLEQIRTIDKTRIGEYIGQVDERTMNDIDRAIQISFGITNSEVKNEWKNRY